MWNDSLLGCKIDYENSGEQHVYSLFEKNNTGTSILWRKSKSKVGKILFFDGDEQRPGIFKRHMVLTICVRRRLLSVTDLRDLKSAKEETDLHLSRITIII
jgi:hypothetical protein